MNVNCGRIGIGEPVGGNFITYQNVKRAEIGFADVARYIRTNYYYSSNGSSSYFDGRKGSEAATKNFVF